MHTEYPDEPAFTPQNKENSNPPIGYPAPALIQDQKEAFICPKLMQTDLI